MSIDRLQLVGITSLLIAAKYEEIYAPFIQELAYITADAYTSKQIRDTERAILHKLDFQFNKPHMLNFLRRYSKLAGVTSIEHSLAKYILELSLMQAELSVVPPSLKAAASLQLAIQLASKQTTTLKWPLILAQHSTYKASQLVDTRMKLKEALCFGQKHPDLNSTKNKFKLSRFGRVADLTVLRGLTQ